jgi:hypothetical protein
MEAQELIGQLVIILVPGMKNVLFVALHVVRQKRTLGQRKDLFTRVTRAIIEVE